MSISNLMGSSRVALSAYQSAIATTSKNISNVGNPDYVRRRADLGSLINPNSGAGFKEEDSIQRIESGFIQRQLWYKNQFLGRYETDELIYAQVETLFNEPSNSGLASMMSEFWNSWNDLGNDPESATAKAIVKDKATLMTDTFNQLSSDLNTMSREIGDDIKDTIEEVNKLLHEIKTINETMSSNYSYDLADSRDAAITKLSKHMNIEVTENRDHVVSITTGGNILVPLVNNDFVNDLEVAVPKYGEYQGVKVSFSEGGSLAAISGGTLGSLLEVQNDSIPGYLAEIDNLAMSIAEEVNLIHRTGYNLDNETGLNFFDPATDGAAGMKVSDAILSDPTRIATSSNIDEAGNGNIANAINELQNGYHLDNVKFSDYYNTLIADVGSKVQEANFLRISQEMVVTSIQNHRDSISGVSLDEEMSNLIKYEQAYQAASRMISVADELIQAVLNLI